jgi:hypothetical protein
MNYRASSRRSKTRKRPGCLHRQAPVQITRPRPKKIFASRFPKSTFLLATRIASKKKTVIVKEKCRSFMANSVDIWEMQYVQQFPESRDTKSNNRIEFVVASDVPETRYVIPRTRVDCALTVASLRQVSFVYYPSCEAFAGHANCEREPWSRCVPSSPWRDAVPSTNLSRLDRPRNHRAGRSCPALPSCLPPRPAVAALAC